MIKEGFYFYKNGVYFGCYEEEQVSGQGKITGIREDHIKTKQPITDEDWAVRLWDNHCLLEPEYEDLKVMLSKMRSFMSLNTEQEIDFYEVEKRLDVSLPRELKQIYSAIYNIDIYFAGEEHFLSLEEIYVEQGVIVFLKKKRTALAGYDMKSGCLARYYKKKWSVECGDLCCYQFCVGRVITIALENLPVFKKGRCKGKFVTTLNIGRELEKYCTDEYHLLSELNVYGIATLYSEDGLIAWIRSNGFYADIHVGAPDESYIVALGEHLGEIVWK